MKRLFSSSRIAGIGRRTAALSAACVGMLAAAAQAASFTPGDLVINRSGTGGTLTSAATAVSIVELTTSGGNPAGGANVINLPNFSTANQGGLTDGGSSGTQGPLNLSPNGQYLSLSGYDAPIGTSSITSSASATNWRNIAQITNAGTVSIVAKLTDAFNANNTRSAITDTGTAGGYYVAGNGDFRLANTSSGVPTTSTSIYTAQNLQYGSLVVDSAWNEHLVMCSAKTAPWISYFSSPFPTSTATPTTLFGGSTLSAPTAFVMLDLDGNPNTGGLGGIDTIYVADGTIKKFNWSGSAWVAAGSVAGSFNGLTAKVVGTSVELFATTAAASNNSLVTYTDTTGLSGSIPGGASATTLASAGTGYAFRYVQFAPLPVTISTTGSLAALSTSSGIASAPTSFAVSGTALSGSLSVLAPSGFEISTSSNSGYSSNLSLAETSGSVASTNIYVRLAAADAPATYSGNIVCSSSNVASVYVPLTSSTVTGSVPTITLAGSVSALSATYGTASASGTFSVAGSNLTNNIVGTAPSGFEISTSSNSGFSNTVTLTESGSAVASTTIYVRLTGSDAAGAHSGNVSFTSTGATTQNEAIPSSTVSPLALTVSGAAVTTKSWDGTTAATITGTLNGIVGSDVVTLVGTGTFNSPNDGAGIPVTSTSTLAGTSAGDYTLIQPTGLTGTILASSNLGGLTVGTANLTPAFSLGTTAYTAVVSANASSFTITPTADSSATVTIDGTSATNGSPVSVGLSSGGAVVTVVVTAQGGGTQTYTVTVTQVTPFTAGNLAVEQLAANATSSTFSIIELDPEAANQDAPINSFPIASTGSNALRQSSAGSTGRLAASNDGTLLAFAAFEDPTGVPDETSITQRAAASLNANYDYAVEASYNDPAGNGDQTRGATFNNGTWYMSDKNGIWLSGTTAANTTNTRPIKSFGGTVYALSDNTSNVISSVSANGTTLTGLTGLPSDGNALDFYMISSGVNGSKFDIAYWVDGATVVKYSLVNGTWVANGSATALGVTGDGFCAAGNGTGAYLYVTTGASNTVVRVTDAAGYNTAPSINTANNVTLYTASSGFLKGVAFAPLSSALPDLTISGSAPFIASSGTFGYTLTLANSGAASASGVTAQFTLPSGLTYVSATDNGAMGFSGSNNNGVITFTGGTLNSGTSDTITVAVSGSNGTYTVDAGSTPAAGHGSLSINTTASTATPIAESNSSNNVANTSVITLVGSEAYLNVGVAGPSSALANGTFAYTITTTNIGNASATSASVQLTLPAGVSYVSGTDTGSGGFAPSYASGVVTFSGGALAASGTENLTVTVSSTTSTYRIYTVTLPAHAAVVTPSGNTSLSAVTTSITLPSGPDLVVAATPDGPVQPGDSSDSFTLYASNDGTTAESGTVTVTYTLPTGFTYVSGSGSGWTVVDSGQTITATYTGGLQPGAGSSALTVNVSVASNAAGSLSSTAVVSSTDDAFSGNDSDSNTIQVGPPATYTTAGSLIVSRAHYVGNANTITVGETLPNGSTATVSGAYPYVWADETPDVSFGVTAPVYMDVISASSSLLYSSSVANTTNVTSLIQQQLGMNVTTSFSSKSEVGLHLTPDGSGVTFMAYVAPANTLDVSNANTPYHDDPTSPLATHGDFQHAVVQLNYLGQTQVTPIDAYSGDNSRNAILAQAGGTNYYYIVGSAGNSGAGVTGSTMSMLAQCTGVQMIQPGAGGLTTPVGEAFGTSGNTTGYQLGYAGQPTDKTGKDMNLRGLTLNPYNNTFYASKGSGGSGVDTVYQIGSGLPTVTTASNVVYSIPSGLPQPGSSGYYPFGMFFANASTLYIADEGEVPPSPVTYSSSNGIYTEAIPANNPNAGLQKWVNSMPDGSGTWTMVYVLQNGLKLGQPYNYTINNYPTGTNSVTGVPWQPANNGLRNIAAKLNGDGTVTIYAITSTVSGETDIGADPNQLVCISDTIANTVTSATNQSFSVLEVADGLDALRGVAIAQQAPLDTAATSSNVTYQSASVGGNLNPEGTETQVYVQYGTTTGYGQETSLTDLGSGSGMVPFTFGLTGLQANTTYNYRLVVVTGSGATYYQNQTFTTPSGVPAMQPWMYFALPGILVGLAAWNLRRKGMPRIS